MMMMVMLVGNILIKTGLEIMRRHCCNETIEFGSVGHGFPCCNPLLMLLSGIFFLFRSESKKIDWKIKAIPDPTEHRAKHIETFDYQYPIRLTDR